MHQIVTISSFVFFTALVAFVTWLMTRKEDVKSKEGYFLAGRSLTYPFIAGSLLLTNLSTEQMVGLNGSAFKEGLCVMAWEVVAVIALVAMAMFFLPRFLKSGIATLPEYLHIRFDRTTAIITNIIFLIAYMVILLPIILYTGAAGLSGIMNVPAITGIQSYMVNLWLMVWFIGIVGMIYALFGGLRSVAVSDTLNGIGLLIGGFMILYFGLHAISGGAGWLHGLNTLVEALPDKFNSIGGPKSEVPFATLFTGILIINMFYWCTNQQIIQRTFAASSLAEGQKGVLLCAFLKLIGPLYLVLPGIIAFYMFKDAGLRSDDAYGKLVSTVLPAPLTGFFAAVMTGAILSSFNSALNATCTLFSLGIYKEVFNRQATEPQLVRSGKIFGFVIAVASMVIAPLLANTGSIFAYLQKMNGIYFIPIFSVVLVGMLSKHTPAIAAKTALIGGCILIAIGYFVPPFSRWVDAMNAFHFVGAVFLALCLYMLAWAKIAGRPTPFIQEDVKAVDMTSWKFAPYAGALLILVVAVVYISFAK